MKLIYTPPITSSGCVGVRRRTRNSIYVGGKDCAKNIDELNKAGIKFILNVTPEKDSGIKSGVVRSYYLVLKNNVIFLSK